MFKKIFYTVKSFIILVLSLKNPWVLIGYFFGLPVRLDFRNGIILSTSHWLEAIVAKETILDDDYQLGLLCQPVRQPPGLPEGLVVDVGAGVGDFTVLAAKKFPQAKIIAFEPNPDQFHLLQFNIKLNQLTKKIKAYNLAIGTKKTYQLFIPSSSVHASTIKGSKKGKKIKVKGERLDRFITGLIDLIKIDCEGAEIDILNSISPKKMRLIKRLVIEYHNHVVKNEDKKITTILRRFGFKLQQQENKIVPGTGYILATSASARR